MKKNNMRMWAVWAIIVVLYHVLAFVIPFNRTPVFYIAYGFTGVSLLVLLYAFNTAFRAEKSVASRFYGFPVARVGVIYAAVQMVLGFVFMVLSAAAPVWVAVIAFALVLAAGLIGLISTEGVHDEIRRQDEALKANVVCICKLQSLSSSLVDQVEHKKAAEALQKLADDFRFSDPVSAPCLAEVENELTICMEEVQQAVMEGDAENILALCARAHTLLEERNRLCRLMK